jgi:hypothetical protein
MAASGRTALIVFVLAAAACTVAFAPRSTRRVLDSSEPIAADGSMTAGRAATIYDTNPLYGAFKPPLPGSDDPQDIAADLKHATWTAEYDRGPIKKLLGPLDWTRCRDVPHMLLVSAVRTYYGTRGREISRFSIRGPNAKTAIEAIWSTPDDRQIDDFVRHALQYGILHKSDFPEKTYPEFTRVFAEVQELGAGCATAGKS